MVNILVMHDDSVDNRNFSKSLGVVVHHVFLLNSHFLLYNLLTITFDPLLLSTEGGGTHADADTVSGGGKRKSEKACEDH